MTIKQRREQLKRRENLFEIPEPRNGFMYLFACHGATILTSQQISRIVFSVLPDFTLRIESIYTDERYRKCGVAGWLFDELLKRYPNTKRVVTASDTRRSRHWLAARGFKRNQDGELEMVR